MIGEQQMRAEVGPPRRLGKRTLMLSFGAIAGLFVVVGAVFAIYASHLQAPAFPPLPPHTQQVWASQTTDMLQGNQVLSRALYRMEGTPTQIIAYYRRTLPYHGGMNGLFNSIVRSNKSGAQPLALQHLPVEFATIGGTHGHARTDSTDYTYTEYSVVSNDIGIAVDLRHPHGPTLVFVEMLSN